MSPRAAWRLEQLGFDANDYALGKSDWLAWGHDYEGEADLIGRHLTTQVPACGIGATVGDVRDRLQDSRLGFVVVVTDQGIVLGRLRSGSVTDVASDVPVAAVMHEGPTTVRPATERGQMLHRMEHAGVGDVLVTRSDGFLLGVLEAAQTAHG